MEPNQDGRGQEESRSGITVVRAPVALADLRKLAEGMFDDLVKAVVDVGHGIMVIGGELHADEEAMLITAGSSQGDLWGINLYPDRYEGPDFIEFDSMINVRPSQGNRTRSVDDPATRVAITEIVARLVRP